MVALVALADDQHRFDSHLDHLDAELQLLDLLILRAVVEMRSAATTTGESQGIYISHEEVDRLLEPSVPRSRAGQLGDLDRRIEELRSFIVAAVADTIERGIPLPLPMLAARLGLSDLEYQAIVICLAPELDRKYDRLYAYLQDDLTRKRPSVDLIISLIATDQYEAWLGLRSFSAHAPLRRFEIVHDISDPHSPSGSTALAMFVALDPRVFRHLLGEPNLDDRLVSCAAVISAAPLSDRRLASQAKDLASVIDEHIGREDGGMLVCLRGRRGSRRSAIAVSAAKHLGKMVVHLELAHAPTAIAERTAVVDAAVREAWLREIPLVVAGADLLFNTDGVSALGRAIIRYPAIVITTSEAQWPEWQLPIPRHEVSVVAGTASSRAENWRLALEAVDLHANDELIDTAAGRYELTPGEIDGAVGYLRRADTTRDANHHLDLAAIHRAARHQASHKLRELARRVDPVHGWDDLVLETRSRRQLELICEQVSLRDVVLDDWGLGQKVAPSRGIAALFSGPSGTGKTMAAGVIAAELMLDLYVIDLSQVVSKYIGETEKNLSRIFSEAESTSAVLFFDEADALFGKRTEIGDAHDRYANIETSYLLQRMEQHGGVAILASNFPQNLDEAFMRRLGFVVDFSFPDAAARAEIWRRHLALDAPLGELDIHALSDLEVSGGNIRNIVLGGAYRAAAAGEAIGMSHLLAASRHEFDKVGKLWSQPDSGVST